MRTSQGGLFHFSSQLQSSVPRNLVSRTWVEYMALGIWWRRLLVLWGAGSREQGRAWELAITFKGTSLQSASWRPHLLKFPWHLQIASPAGNLSFNTSAYQPMEDNKQSNHYSILSHGNPCRWDLIQFSFQRWETQKNPSSATIYSSPSIVLPGLH